MMCHTSIPVRVLVPADLSHTGEAYWKDTLVDRCIAPIVQALQAAGIHMRGSCCGHGRAPGEIELEDGRTLTIHSREEADDQKALIDGLGESLKNAERDRHEAEQKIRQLRRSNMALMLEVEILAGLLKECQPWIDDAVEACVGSYNEKGADKARELQDRIRMELQQIAASLGAERGDA